jgi:dephospho-CoA kinase
VPVIALTGGIAAGKSTVSNRLAELGAQVISADELVRYVQRGGSNTLAAIKQRFGFGVISADGELDRAALGRLIFGDALARRDLEAIVHPAVQAESQRRIAEFLAIDPNAIVVYDIPLLVESARTDEFDAVIVIACDPQIRHDRLVTLRTMSDDDAWARINAQASEAQRLAVADWVIDSSDSLESTLAQTDDVWNQLVTAYRA